MRHQVPFVGERKVVRADDEQARAKRLNGKVIDDVVADGVAPSSWEDEVPEGWADKSTPKVSKPVPTPNNTRAPSSPTPSPKVPLHTGGSAKLPPSKSTHSKAVAKKPSGPAITFSDVASLDWIPINNGRGLRVNIHGCIDNDLRKEWSRLLQSTAESGIEEFEFNLGDTPALSLTGLGMLLLFKERKCSARESISLCNCNKEVAELLEWTGMDRYFVIKTTQISSGV